MSDLEKTLAQPTMSSIELLALINQARAAFNEPEVRRNQFNARVEDELEGTHYKKTVVTNENGTESVVFELSQDQCMLVSMRESKAVRRWVLNRLNALEAERKQVVHPPVVIPDFMNPAEAARAWAAEFEAKHQVALVTAQEEATC